MAKLEETDAAWIAADRAAFGAEKAREPLAVAAMFRMAHVFLVLGRMDQAQHVAARSARPCTLSKRPSASPWKKPSCTRSGRAVTRDLLQLSGLRPRPELR